MSTRTQHLAPPSTRRVAQQRSSPGPRMTKHFRVNKLATPRDDENEASAVTAVRLMHVLPAPPPRSPVAIDTFSRMKRGTCRSSRSFQFAPCCFFIFVALGAFFALSTSFHTLAAGHFPAARLAHITGGRWNHTEPIRPSNEWQPLVDRDSNTYAPEDLLRFASLTLLDSSACTPSCGDHANCWGLPVPSAPSATVCQCEAGWSFVGAVHLPFRVSASIPSAVGASLSCVVNLGAVYALTAIWACLCFFTLIYSSHKVLQALRTVESALAKQLAKQQFTSELPLVRLGVHGWATKEGIVSVAQMPRGSPLHFTEPNTGIPSLASKNRHQRPAFVDAFQAKQDAAMKKESMPHQLPLHHPTMAHRTSSRQLSQDTATSAPTANLTSAPLTSLASSGAALHSREESQLPGSQKIPSTPNRSSPDESLMMLEAALRATNAQANLPGTPNSTQPSLARASFAPDQGTPIGSQVSSNELPPPPFHLDSRPSPSRPSSLTDEASGAAPAPPPPPPSPPAMPAPSPPTPRGLDSAGPLRHIIVSQVAHERTDSGGSVASDSSSPHSLFQNAALPALSESSQVAVEKTFPFHRPSSSHASLRTEPVAASLSIPEHENLASADLDSRTHRPFNSTSYLNDPKTHSRKRSSAGPSLTLPASSPHPAAAVAQVATEAASAVADTRRSTSPFPLPVRNNSNNANESSALPSGSPSLRGQKSTTALPSPSATFLTLPTASDGAPSQPMLFKSPSAVGSKSDLFSDQRERSRMDMSVPRRANNKEDALEQWSDEDLPKIKWGSFAFIGAAVQNISFQYSMLALLIACLHSAHIIYFLSSLAFSTGDGKMNVFNSTPAPLASLAGLSFPVIGLDPFLTWSYMIGWVCFTWCTHFFFLSHLKLAYSMKGLSGVTTTILPRTKAHTSEIHSVNHVSKSGSISVKPTASRSGISRLNKPSQVEAVEMKPIIPAAGAPVTAGDSAPTASAASSSTPNSTPRLPRAVPLSQSPPPPSSSPRPPSLSSPPRSALARGGSQDAEAAPPKKTAAVSFPAGYDGDDGVANSNDSGVASGTGSSAASFPHLPPPIQVLPRADTATSLQVIWRRSHLDDSDDEEAPIERRLPISPEHSRNRLPVTRPRAAPKSNTLLFPRMPFNTENLLFRIFLISHAVVVSVLFLLFGGTSSVTSYSDAYLACLRCGFIGGLLFSFTCFFLSQLYSISLSSLITAGTASLNLKQSSERKSVLKRLSILLWSDRAGAVIAMAACSLLLGFTAQPDQDSNQRLEQAASYLFPTLAIGMLLLINSRLWTLNWRASTAAAPAPTNKVAQGPVSGVVGGGFEASALDSPSVHAPPSALPIMPLLQNRPSVSILKKDSKLFVMEGSKRPSLISSKPPPNDRNNSSSLLSQPKSIEHIASSAAPARTASLPAFTEALLPVASPSSSSPAPLPSPSPPLMNSEASSTFSSAAEEKAK